MFVFEDVAIEMVQGYFSLNQKRDTSMPTVWVSLTGLLRLRVTLLNSPWGKK